MDAFCERQVALPSITCVFAFAFALPVQARWEWPAAQLAHAVGLSTEALRARIMFWINQGVLTEARTAAGLVSAPHPTKLHQPHASFCCLDGMYGQTASRRFVSAPKIIYIASWLCDRKCRDTGVPQRTQWHPPVSAGRPPFLYFGSLSTGLPGNSCSRRQVLVHLALTAHDPP